MADTLPLDGLVPEARRELVDFYEFLKAKYGNRGSAVKDSSPDPFLYDKVKIDTTKLHFSRDERQYPESSEGRGVASRAAEHGYEAWAESSIWF